MRHYNLFYKIHHLGVFYLINNTPEPWYESNLFCAIIGATIALITTVITIHISNKQKKIDDKKNTIILITQTNQELFSYIYEVSKNINKMNHTKFRELLKNFSIIYILPNNLKSEFNKILEIYMLPPNQFSDKSSDIFSHCKNIVAYLNTYGDDIFNE